MRKLAVFIISMLFFQSGFAQNEWTIIHPTPTLSNLIDVHFLSENEGWAVGRYGTILYTDDAGDEWEFQHFDEDESFWSVFFIDSLEGWVCGWSMIYHTVDAGVTWEAQNHPYCQGDLTDVFFIDHDTGWIVGRYKIVLKTTDGGENWTKIMNNIYQDGGFKRVDFFDHLHGCAVGDNLGAYPHSGFVMITDDGGDTWTETTPENCHWITDVEYYNDSCVWICGSDAGLYKSINGGKTWSKIDTYNSFNEIHFFNQDDGMLLETSSARRSYDAGISWDTQIMIDEISSGYRAFMSWEDAKGVAVGYDGVISRTLDGCHSWEPLHDGLRLYMGEIGFFNQFDGLAMGGTTWEAELLKTNDGGYSWDYDTIVGGGPFSEMHMKGQQCYLLNQDSLLIKKTFDGGANWLTLPVPPPIEYYQEMIFVNENIGYICGNEGNLIKTENGGESWIDLSWNEYNSFRDMFFVDEDHGWLLDYDTRRILHTIDGGITWSANTLGNGLIYQPGVIFFTDADNGILHTEEGWMYTSQDGGETWDEWGYLASSAYSKMHFVNENEGWLLSGRIFHTLDGGETWDEGQPIHSVTRSMYFIDENQGWLGGSDGMIAVYDGTVDIKEDNETNPGIVLFPNPVKDNLNVLINEQGDELLLSLYDIHGREISEHIYRNTNGPLQIDVSDLPPGTYVLNIKSIDRQISSKFVKM